MRKALLLLAATAGCANPYAHLRLPPGFSTPVQRSDHFVLRADLPPETCRTILEIAEKTRERLADSLGTGSGPPGVIFAVSREETFVRTKRARAALGPAAAAFYCPDHGEIVAHWLPPEKAPLQVVAFMLSHEVVHQHFGEQWGRSTDDLWISEGLADHFALGHETLVDFVAAEHLVFGGYLQSLRDLVERPLQRPVARDEIQAVTTQHQGHLLLDFLQKRSGGRFAEWLRAFARGPAEAPSLLAVAGITPEALEQEWRRYVEDRYLDYLEVSLQQGNPGFRERQRKRAEFLTGLVLEADTPEEAARRFQEWRLKPRPLLGLVELRPLYLVRERLKSKPD